MTIYKTETIPVAAIHFDFENRRLEGLGLASEEEIIQALLQDFRVPALVRHIVKHGMSPAHRMIVMPSEDGGYIALDGNRRLAALKYLNSPEAYAESLKPTEDMRKFMAGNPQYETVDAVVFKNRDDAKPMLDLEHAGLQQGAGTLRWDPAWKGFPGALIRSLGLSQVDYRGKSTTIERAFAEAETRKKLGIKYESATDTLYLPSSEAERGNIIKVVSEASKLTSRDLDKQEDREEFLQGLRIPEAKSKLQRVSARKTPPKRKRGTGSPEKIQEDVEMTVLLEESGNYKLQALYRSIYRISTKQHTALVAVGIWSFIESLVAWHRDAPPTPEEAEEEGGTTFVRYIEARLKGKSGRWGGLKKNKPAHEYTAPLEAIAKLGNAVKHSPKRTSFNPASLANEFEVVLPVLKALLLDIADRPKGQQGRS